MTQHEWDQETGLDYRGARYYDSDVARFLSLDPHATNYPSLSAYNYVAGNPIVLIDPNGKDIDWGVKGKERWKLKRALRFQRKFDREFNNTYKSWKKDKDVTHVLRWQGAPIDKQVERGTDRFETPYERSNLSGDRQSHYFHKQRIEIKNLVSSTSLNGEERNGKGAMSETISNLNIETGEVVVSFDMYSAADELNVKNQSGDIITSTPGAVRDVGSVRGELNDVTSITVNVNEGNYNTDSEFNVNIRIYDNSKALEKTYTHSRGAIRKASKQ